MNIEQLRSDIADIENALEAAIETGDKETEKAMREFLDDAKRDLANAEAQLSGDEPKPKAAKTAKSEPAKTTGKRVRKAGTTKKPAEKKATKTSKAKPKKVKEKNATQPKEVRIVGKTVEFKGKEYPSGSKELCDAILESFKERREKAKKQAKKAKTKSVFEKAADKVESTIVSAVKETFAENKEKIVKQPDQYFAKIQKVQAAGQEFLESFKDLVGSEFDRKEITDFTKTIKDAVEGLKKEIEKIAKESK